MKVINKITILFSALFFVFYALSATAHNKNHVVPLVSDISSSIIKVTTSFSGESLLLFGAIDDEGDVAVVVRGPFDDVVVRKKIQIAGVWLNGDGLIIKKTPSFYHAAATGDLLEIASQKTLKQLQIGGDNLYLEAKEKDAKDFKNAFKDIKEHEKLYSSEVGSIKLLGNKLFRTDIIFPANAPIGDYLVEVYLFKNKKLIGMEITPLKILKTGIEAKIHAFAMKDSFAYGFVAVLIACVFGLCANLIFHKT